MPIPTATEHHQALSACHELRRLWPTLPTKTLVGTAENDIQNALYLLNELAGHHACRTSMDRSRYAAALRLIESPTTLTPCALAAPAHTQGEEFGGCVVCTTSTGRRYAVTRSGNGWARGYTFGATVADAMRGADA